MGSLSRPLRARSLPSRPGRHRHQRRRRRRANSNRLPPGTTNFSLRASYLLAEWHLRLGCRIGRFNSNRPTLLFNSSNRTAASFRQGASHRVQPSCLLLLCRTLRPSRDRCRRSSRGTHGPREATLLVLQLVLQALGRLLDRASSKEEAHITALLHLSEGPRTRMAGAPLDRDTTRMAGGSPSSRNSQ